MTSTTDKRPTTNPVTETRMATELLSSECMKLLESNIILEGCDKVGKTSIAKELVKLCPALRVFKFNNPTSFEYGRGQYDVLLNMLRQSTGWVFDRSALGECIYAPIVRGYYPTYMREWEKSVPDNTWLFLIDCDASIVKQRFDDKFIKREDIPTVLGRFRMEYSWSNYQHKKIIRTDNNTAQECALNIAHVISETR